MEQTKSLVLVNIPDEIFAFAQETQRNGTSKVSECYAQALVKFSVLSPEVASTIVEVAPLTSFARILLCFQNTDQAQRCKQYVNEQKQSNIKAYQVSDALFEQPGEYERYLIPPENDKMFLISPPASPPSDWVQITESDPTSHDAGYQEMLVNHLNDRLSDRLHLGQNDSESMIRSRLPQIVIENVEQEHLDVQSQVPGKILKTKMPSVSR
ncbi:hypothetical protein MP228_003989 [Amoeboaphelidium protococcarum]|nr:hypothetical protein MP228_003989 [Amoeboaphelidium protococcarum]